MGYVVTIATAIGNRNFHPYIYSWSNLYLGTQALTQSIKNNKRIGWKVPKNNILKNADIVNILAYSPKKKKANGTAPCSVIKPATNSDSASGKSNGARFVSAIADTINN